ncbi:hypothetical protein LMIY3S_01997 [Labrys miyagiensis]
MTKRALIDGLLAMAVIVAIVAGWRLPRAEGLWAIPEVIGYVALLVFGVPFALDRLSRLYTAMKEGGSSRPRR